MIKGAFFASKIQVLVKHVHTRVARPARIVVIDPPNRRMFGDDKDCNDKSISRSHGLYSLPRIMLNSSNASDMRQDVAYLSPMLAFNLGVHIEWVQLWLSCNGNDSDNSLTDGVHQSYLKDDPSSFEFLMVDVCSLWQLLRFSSPGYPKEVNEGKVNIEKTPLKFAYHVRIGHIKVPVSGVVQMSTSYSSSEGQEDLDNALQEYFKCSRVLARGDTFSVKFVVDPKQNLSLSREERIVFFKVCVVHALLYRTFDAYLSRQTRHMEPFMSIHVSLFYPFFNVFLSRQVIAMEPETEPFLWVNSNQTALVIGNSVSSQLPPSLFMPDSSIKPKSWVAPLIDQMTRLLAPCLHPNAPSLKLRTSILICGPAGMTWILLFLYIAD